MTTTQNQISRIAQDWSKIAKEPVKVENVSYRNSGDSAKADFSKNLNTWFFRIELAN